MSTRRREFLQRSAAFATAMLASGVSQASGSVQSRIAGTQHDLASIRAQFPGLRARVNGHPLVYLDSAATSQRPLAVINAISDYFSHENANPSKTLHATARRSAERYDNARRTAAKFVNAREPDEIVWTRGTTEAINVVASSWASTNLQPGDEILLTVSEHYSNLVPWQLAANRAQARLRFLDVDDDGNLRLDLLDRLLSHRTKLVAVSHVSNVLGLINPVNVICERAHKVGAMVLVDGAQSAPHIPIDVQGLGCDFFAFSGHKILGPMGIGVLWARREILDRMAPYQAGSNMVHDVEIDAIPTEFAEGSLKFEAGTPNVAGAVGLASAVEFLNALGRAELWSREQTLTRYAFSRLGEVKGLNIFGKNDSSNRVSVFSFVMKDKQPPAVVQALDAAGIAVRAGDLAALPLLKRMGVTSAVRASCSLYTTQGEIDRLVDVLKRL